MNCSPTISAESFKQLHNGLWELDCMVEKLVSGNVREGQKLSEIAKTIRNSLKEAYEQDNKSFDVKNDHYESVRLDLGLSAVWSIYEVDNLNERHPYGDVLQVAYTDHWGEQPVYVEVNGLTWAALYVAANAAIRDSGDRHHIYIEDFRPNPKNPQQLILSTGS